MADPLACVRVPLLEWPSSVPPVMVILAPEARFSVMIPSIVFTRTPSRDVQLEFDLSEQLPLEVMEIPAGRRRATASGCVSFRPGESTESRCGRRAYETNQFSSGPPRLRGSKAYFRHGRGSDCSVRQGCMRCLSYRTMAAIFSLPCGETRLSPRA